VARRRIHVVPRAQRDIQEALAWWAEHRPAAPGAIVDELRAAFRLLRLQPELGARPQSSRLQDMRRVYLARIRYHLYYRVRAEREVIEILAFWHASREDDPL
jgi:plasmid stabilization system protein ParE